MHLDITMLQILVNLITARILSTILNLKLNIEYLMFEIYKQKYNFTQVILTYLIVHIYNRLQNKRKITISALILLKKIKYMYCLH